MFRHLLWLAMGFIVALLPLFVSVAQAADPYINTGL